MWIFTRVQKSNDPSCAFDEYRRLNPWFGELSDDECAAAMVVGSAERCRARLAALGDELNLDFSGDRPLRPRRGGQPCHPPGNGPRKA